MDIYINKYLCDFLSLPLHGESDKRLFVKTRKKKQSLTGNIRHCQIRESGWEVEKKKRKKKKLH